MFHIEDSPQDGSEPGSDPIVIFLGLYLLLTAFFILLNSISTIEESKLKDALSSVNNAFKTVGLPTTPQTFFTSDVGAFAEASSSLLKVGDLVKTAIPLARIKEVRPGQLMEARIPLDEFFAPGEAKLTSKSNKMLDSIGAILSKPPLDFRFDVEVLVGTEWILPKDIEKGETLAILRAGTIARELRARGAPVETTIAGVEVRENDDIRFIFYVQSADLPVVNFKQLLDEVVE